jgi:hypothetical protein
MAEFNLKDDIETKEEAEFKSNVDLMHNRRKMAYFSLYATALSAILLVVALIVKPELLVNYPKIETTVGTIILGWFSVIALYFGASSLAEVFGNKIK